MDIMQLFWLFFIVSALQPVLQRRYLEAMRKRLGDRAEAWFDKSGMFDQAACPAGT